MIDLSLDMPKNAKVFQDKETGIIYAVHYDHVVLVVRNDKIVDLYPASQTSCDVIRRVVSELGISRFYFDILKVYNKIHNTDYGKISEIYDWGYKLTGYYSPKRFLKKDWQEREQALEELKPTGCMKIVPVPQYQY